LRIIEHLVLIALARELLSKSTVGRRLLFLLFATILSACVADIGEGLEYDEDDPFFEPALSVEFPYELVEGQPYSYYTFHPNGDVSVTMIGEDWRTDGSPAGAYSVRDGRVLWGPRDLEIMPSGLMDEGGVLWPAWPTDLQQ
jgi:hypothetical protein